MVNQTVKNHSEYESELCQYPEDYGNRTVLQPLGTYDWDETIEGIILSAFYYGYLVTQLPGGWFASKFGGKKPLAFGLLGTVILTIVTPISAELGWEVVVAVRVLMGIVQGVTFPAVYAILASWAPPLERSTMTSMVWIGANLGSTVALPLSGYLCENGFAGGWPSVFYVCGIIGFGCFILLLFLVYDTPHVHPFISNEEKDFIATDSDKANDARDSVPWVKIMTSSPVWGLIIAYFCNSWGSFTFMTTMPLYMSQVLRFDIKANGLVSALPYLVNMCISTTSGLVADAVRRHGLLSTGTVRKIANTIAMMASAGFVLGAGFAGCDRVLAVVCLTFTTGFSGMNVAGHMSNHIDLSPKYSGILMAITNMLGTVAGMVSPIIVGILTNNNPTLKQWRYVLYVASSFYGLGALGFLFLSKGEEQSWSKGDTDEGKRLLDVEKKKGTSYTINENKDT